MKLIFSARRSTPWAATVGEGAHDCHRTTYTTPRAVADDDQGGSRSSSLSTAAGQAPPSTSPLFVAKKEHVQPVSPSSVLNRRSRESIAAEMDEDAKLRFRCKAYQVGHMAWS